MKFCIGRNYVDHALELNNPSTQIAIIDFLMKLATALLTDGKPFYHPISARTSIIEIELVLKIRKKKNIVPDLETTIMMRLDWASILQRGTCKINSKEKDNLGTGQGL